jgi:hypothetical protein
VGGGKKGEFIKEKERQLTVTFMKRVSKKASSPARLSSTSSSAERLISIVKTFLAIGY